MAALGHAPVKECGGVSQSPYPLGSHESVCLEFSLNHHSFTTDAISFSSGCRLSLVWVEGCVVIIMVGAHHHLCPSLGAFLSCFVELCPVGSTSERQGIRWSPQTCNLEANLLVGPDYLSCAIKAGVLVLLSPRFEVICLLFSTIVQIQ